MPFTLSGAGLVVALRSKSLRADVSALTIVITTIASKVRLGRCHEHVVNQWIKKVKFIRESKTKEAGGDRTRKGSL